MTTTNIEWADRVWNPVTGCQKVSPGCKHCYAETVANRFWATQYPAIPVSTPADLDATNTFHRPRRFTDVMKHEDRLREPLKWRKPARVFVNSMSDLFHEDVPYAFIDQVFAVMALAPRHTFIVLTKRPQRMRDYCHTLGRHHECDRVSIAAKALQPDGPGFWWTLRDGGAFLPNVWLGVSVEDQQRADERIPLLLQTQAAVRFVSAEPLLGSVDLSELPSRFDGENRPLLRLNALKGGHWCGGQFGPETAKLDWVIVGGESGPGARPCEVAWVRSIVQQCQAATVPVFVKQLGSDPHGTSGEAFTALAAGDQQIGDAVNDALGGHGYPMKLRSRKGGDPTQWPDDLRVREWPALRGKR